MPLDLSAVAEFSLWAYLVVFAAGIVTSIGPCNIAVIPLVIAYVGGQKHVGRGRGLALSTLFALGQAITLALLGVAASLVGGMLGGNTRLWYYVVAAVCVVMGMQWLGILSLPLPEFGAGSRDKVRQKGLLGALLLGLVSGLISSGCATPGLAAILTLVMAKGAIVYGASLLLVYGLGRGVPIVLLGTFAGLIGIVPRLARWTARLQQVSGGLMVGIGMYLLWIA
ncbi:MAG: cytochrome c biogenesis CcdA family protein [Anaerolineae bacterium]